MKSRFSSTFYLYGRGRVQRHRCLDRHKMCHHLSKGLFTWRQEDPSTRKILEGETTFRLVYMQKFLSRWKWRMKARWRSTDNKNVIWVLTSFKPIFLLAISQLILMYLTAQRFRHCCRSIARYFPLCLSFGRCIFGTKLVLNIIGAHQNH